jgi:hypothetical protein
MTDFGDVFDVIIVLTLDMSVPSVPFRFIIRCERKWYSDFVKAASEGVVTVVVAAMVKVANFDLNNTLVVSERLNKEFVDHFTYVYRKIEEAEWSTANLKSVHYSSRFNWRFLL